MNEEICIKTELMFYVYTLAARTSDLSLPVPTGVQRSSDVIKI